MMFVGRNKELEKLNKMYESNKFEFPVFYGRRRVGKTTLIREFCKNKKSIYFMATQTNEKTNLENLSKAIFSIIMPETNINPIFKNFNELFEYLYQISKNDRIILVIDEYPYLADSFKPISSILQESIDMKLKDSKLFLILCGSSMSFMENQVLGYKSPLYGRRTAQFKVKPFNFFETLKYLKEFNNEEKAIIYGVTGGIPEYLSHFESSLSLEDNIIELFLTESGKMFEEPTDLLKQELREPQLYNVIITAIAKGASRLNQISTAVGVETAVCSKYLNTLISLGIIKKEFPITEEISKKSIYVLEDQMFRFWYRFVFTNISGIISEQGKMIYKIDILPQLNSYMGYVFEQISIQYLWKLAAEEKTPFFYQKVGRWWGNNSIKKRQEEIDILAFRGNNALFGECKWKNDYVDVDVLNDLIEQTEMFNYKNKWIYLFSKSGYTDKCIKAIENLDNIKLICFNEICNL